MSHKVYAGIAALLLSVLACSFFTKPNNNGPVRNDAVAESTSAPASEPTLMQNVSSSAKLELYAYQYGSEDIGNGMKKISVLLVGKNASTQWASYGLVFPMGEGVQCLWLIGSSAMNNFQPSRPILITKEGYEYRPNVSSDEYCGKRRVGDVPPGTIFTIVGDTYDDVARGILEGWGFVSYNIPQNATPDTITFNYTLGYIGLGQTDVGGTVEVQVKDVKDFDELTPDLPIDSVYMKYVDMVNVGEEVSIGNLANATFTSQSQADGSTIVNMKLTSLDEGYPIDVSAWSVVSMLYGNGAICCSQSPTGNNFAPTVGPLQTAEYQTSWKNPDHFGMWLIVELQIEENGVSDNSALRQFVVKLP